MTDPAEPTGATAPQESPPPKRERRRVLATVATVLTAIAAALSIFMFFSDTRSLREFLSRKAAEQEEQPASNPRGEDGRDVAGEDGAGETTIAIPIEAFDGRSRTFPLEARVESIRGEGSETLVTLALTNRSSETLRYLHAVRSGVQSQNATDRFDLIASDGEALAQTGQRGLVASADGAHQVFCLSLSPQTRASLTLEFPGGAPAGPMTLLHTSDPDLVRYRSCGGTTIALGDFRLDIPQAP